MTTIEHPLDFERELVELDRTLAGLKDQIATGDLSKRAEYERLEQRVNKLRGDIYSHLTPYQRVQLSRHFDRPFTLDYIKFMITDFVELHGDRLCRDDPAIVGGTGWLGDLRLMIIGHQRGRTTTERLKRNFGMPNPEGYRKALRLFEMAEKFSMPVVTLIDTQGAFPGLEAEERGQAEAIAYNLSVMSELTVPMVSVVIGEGGSGGALALGVTDRILMMENACYSVITPEGCASILWGSAAGQAASGQQDRSEAPAAQAAVAAEMLQLTAQDLKRHGIIEEIVPEPLGGAHTNHKEAAENLGAALRRHLLDLGALQVGEMLDRRYAKFRKIGVFTGDS